MPHELLQSLQERLRHPPLKTKDDNRWEACNTECSRHEDLFSQAALPAVLIGLYVYSRSDKGAQMILTGDIDIDWTPLIFASHRTAVIDDIAQFSHATTEDTVIKMLIIIAKETVSLIRERVTESGTISDVKNELAASHDNVLLHLPTSIEVGKLLDPGDVYLANPLKEPKSNLMDAVSRLFSGPNSDRKTSLSGKRRSNSN
ncbi:MAG: hypothetical protein ABIS69_05145 [Sediminibacterium sp.]